MNLIENISRVKRLMQIKENMFLKRRVPIEHINLNIDLALSLTATEHRKNHKTLEEFIGEVLGIVIFHYYATFSEENYFPSEEIRQTLYEMYKDKIIHFYEEMESNAKRFF